MYAATPYLSAEHEHVRWRAHDRFRGFHFPGTVRPNSDIVTSVMSTMRSPIPVKTRQMESAKITQKICKLSHVRLRPYFIDVGIQPPTSESRPPTDVCLNYLG